MRKFWMLVNIVVLCALTVTFAVAQQPTYVPLTVTTGVETGTYYRFAREIAQACPQPPLTLNASKGSLENLDRLLGNEAHLAFVQADALIARKVIDNDPEVDRVKTFMTLYPEEVHLIASGNQFVKTFTDLGNKKVAVYGGSTITSRVLFAKSGFRPIRILTYGTPTEAVQALDKREVDAILGVGGQPLAWVRGLDASYRLVPIEASPQIVQAYQTTSLSYSNLADTGRVRTVAVLSLIATIDYKTAAIRQSLGKLRECLSSKLVQLQEGLGSHPKWRLVDPASKGPWPYFELILPKK